MHGVKSWPRFVPHLDINDVLVLPIVFSWLLYPWVISWLYPNAVRLVFGAGLVGGSLLVLVWGIRQRWQPDRNEHVLAVLVAGYLVSALFASLVFNDADGGLLLRYLLKFAFFLLLVNYLTRKTIFLLFDVYVGVCTALVLFSMAGIVAITMGWEELAYINVVRGVEDGGLMIQSFSGYDGTARIFPESAQFARMQSFAPEPGTLALALLPGLYWAALVRQHYVRATLIALGISASWSFGALLALVLAFLLALRASIISAKSKAFLAASIAFFWVSHAIFTSGVSWATRMVALPSTPSNVAKRVLTGGDKTLSMQQRTDELLEVVDFVRHDFWGAGIGSGRNVLESSISVGYANVFADTGVIGGLLYCLAALLLAYMAMGRVFGRNAESSANTLALCALGLSVLTCLFFGLQREQPDASFWHMWLYASFIVLYQLNGRPQPQNR